MALVIHYAAAERINFGFFKLRRGANSGGNITPERVVKAALEHGDPFARRLPHMRFVLDGDTVTYEHLESLAGDVLARRAADQGSEQGAGESPPPPTAIRDYRGADVTGVCAALSVSADAFDKDYAADLSRIPLSDATYNAARSAISRTEDLEALRIWRSAEARDSVIGLIDARIEKLEA